MDRHSTTHSISFVLLDYGSIYAPETLHDDTQFATQNRLDAALIGIQAPDRRECHDLEGSAKGLSERPQRDSLEKSTVQAIVPTT